MRDINQNPHEPEVGGQFDEEISASNKEKKNVTKTGTTTIGISVDEGVLIATDRRASLGGRFVVSKDVVKVEQIHPTGAITLVGSVGGAQDFADRLEAEASLYKSRRGENISMHALASVASNFARRGPFMRINPILGGVDGEGSHVYTIDPAGGVMEERDYAVTGSGMQLAHGTLETNYEDDMSLDDAARVAGKAIQAAAERDSGSGNGLVLTRITGDGVEVTKYDDYDVVSEL